MYSLTTARRMAAFRSSRDIGVAPDDTECQRLDSGLRRPTRGSGLVATLGRPHTDNTDVLASRRPEGHARRHRGAGEVDDVEGAAHEPDAERLLARNRPVDATLASIASDIQYTSMGTVSLYSL